MPAFKSHSQTNRLLDSLSGAAMAALKPHLEHVDLDVGQRLSVAGKTITHAYFPLSGMISLVHTYENGSTMEVGLIGREGFWGIPLVLGASSSPVEAMVQGKGAALRILADTLLTGSKGNDELRQLLLRYAAFLHVQTSLIAACNGTHKVKQRLVRWLLEADDRLDGDEILISHEFLSYMLGIRRAGVTTALAGLKAQGLITVRRGKIGLGHRKEIEPEACDCYRIVRSEYKNLFAKEKQPRPSSAR